MSEVATLRISLEDLRQMKAQGRKFAMLTAYDYPTAKLAQAAGIHALLVGDSLGQVVLGHETTRHVPLDLMVTLAEAVRRGAPDIYLIGDMPFSAMGSNADALNGARRFVEEAGCDAVKFEAAPHHAGLMKELTDAGLPAIAHLGLRPQTVTSPDGYRAQARDAASIADLVAQARRLTDAGAVMLLLEAIPAQAAQAVVDAVPVPVVGCGAGPACDGHVVVTHDLLGLGGIRPPRFVPVLDDLAARIEHAMRRWAEDIVSQHYPAPEHTYSMRKQGS